MESQVISEEIIEDPMQGVCWKTKEGEIIPVSKMRDSHLRNAALFLMGFGYTNCVAREDRKILWLTILRREWERRMLLRENDPTYSDSPTKIIFNKTALTRR